MEIYYINSKGDRLDFLNSDKYTIQDIEKLFQYNDNYDYVEGSKGKRRYSNFSIKNEDIPLKISFVCDSEEEFDSTLEEVSNVFKYDINKGVMGKLYVNEYYRECFIVSRGYSEYEDLFYTTDVSYSIISENPYWLKESYFEFLINGSQESSSDEELYLDFPYDFMYDFSNKQLSTYVDNDSSMESSFKLIVYGPCTNPSLTIGDNTYNINVTLTSGQYLYVDSLNRKMHKVLSNGEKQNIFSLRDRTKNIYESIKTGRSDITWDNTFGFDLILYDQRGDPR